MVTLYGIKSCDTVRKARRWLEENGVPHRFHDFRSDGLERERLERWAGQLGWEALLNRRSATWRQLPAERKEGLDSARATALMLENPTLIKRPVLESGDTCLVGFHEPQWREALGR